jgi:hypothetical protein
MTHEDGRLLVYCACPYFADFGRCKHLWAAVLEADRRGVLGEAAKGGALRLCRDADPTTIGTGPLGASHAIRPRPRGLRPGRSTSPISAKPGREEAEGAGLAAGIRDPLRGGPNASKIAGAIVLELFRGRGKKNGEWTVNKEFRIAPSQVGSLPDPVDAEAIASILGGQEYYVYAYAGASGAAARKAVPHTLAQRLIPNGAATGRLLPARFLHGLAAARLGGGRALETLAGRAPGRSRPMENHRLAAPRRGAHVVDRAGSLIVEGGFLVAHGKIARSTMAAHSPGSRA